MALTARVVRRLLSPAGMRHPRYLRQPRRRPDLKPYRLLAAVFLATATVSVAGSPALAQSTGSIVPIDQYTSEKARGLAGAHAAELKTLDAWVYHCVPWVDVRPGSVGFFKPKDAPRDDRYLAIRIYVEQDPSEQFARLTLEQQASAMFSRYSGPLLRRMATRSLMADRRLDGFTLVIEWLKQVPRAAMSRPVHETIAAFIDKAVVADFLAGQLRTADVARHARVLGWDGETPMGPLHVAGWEDNFVSTYKVKNYVLDPGASCS